MNIEFSGLTEMATNLRGLGKRVGRAGSRKAVQAGAEVIQRAMQEDTPVQELRSASSNSLDIDELRASMEVRVKADRDDGFAEATVGPDRDTELVALWVEYGHRMVKGGYSKVLPNGKARGPGKASDVDVPPHPFLRPAFERSAEEAGDVMKATLLAEVEKAGK